MIYSLNVEFNYELNILFRYNLKDWPLTLQLHKDKDVMGNWENIIVTVQNTLGREIPQTRSGSYPVNMMMFWEENICIQVKFGDQT